MDPRSWGLESRRLIQNIRYVVGVVVGEGCEAIVTKVGGFVNTDCGKFEMRCIFFGTANGSIT
jgi:hypothetical protein